MKSLLSIFLGLVVPSVVYCQNDMTLRLDLENAYGSQTSKVFNQIDFIPLETTRKSLFSQIDQLAVTESYFIILDNQTNTILLFKKDGSFHAKIESGGEIKFLSYFTINERANEILTAINNEDEIARFSFDGTLLGVEKCPTRAKSLFYFNPDNILFQITRPYTVPSQHETRYDLVYSKGFDQVYKERMPYDPKISPWDFMIASSTLNRNVNGDCMFSLPYDYSVYQLNDTGLVKTYKFLFPAKYSLPPGFATDSVYVSKRSRFVTSPENMRKITWVEKCFADENYIIFKVFYLAGTAIDRNYIYDIKNDKLTSMQHIEPDSSSYYIPVMDFKLGENLLTVKDSFVYSSIPATVLKNSQSKLNQNLKYPAGLQTFFSQENANANPVLIQMRLKKPN